MSDSSPLEITALYSSDGKLYLSSLTDEGEEFALKVTDNELWKFRKPPKIINITGVAEQLEDTELCFMYEYDETITGTWVESYEMPVKTLATVLSSVSNTPCKLLRVQRQINQLANERKYESGKEDGYEKGKQDGLFRGVLIGMLCIFLFRLCFLALRDQHIFGL